MFDLYQRPPNPPTKGSEEDGDDSPFPYVVWRGPAAMYITCTLDLFSGPQEGCLDLTDCWFQHPMIVARSRLVTQDLRVVIETFASQHNLEERRFDLCIVWGSEDGTYVDKTGKVTRSTSLPTSRVGL
jgi:hypothetical protein